MLQKVSLLIRLMLGMVRFGGSLLVSYLIASIVSLGSTFSFVSVYAESADRIPPYLGALVEFLSRNSASVIMIWMLFVFIFVLTSCIYLLNRKSFGSFE